MSFVDWVNIGIEWVPIGNSVSLTLKGDFCIASNCNLIHPTETSSIHLLLWESMCIPYFLYTWGPLVICTHAIIELWWLLLNRSSSGTQQCKQGNSSILQILHAQTITRETSHPQKNYSVGSVSSLSWFSQCGCLSMQVTKQINFTFSAHVTLLSIHILKALASSQPK